MAARNGKTDVHSAKHLTIANNFFSIRFAMKTYVLFILCFLFSGLLLPATAQPEYDITPYTTADGLSQTTATCILQDSKGQLWLSTWDGLNKFNGYTFTVYKSSPGRQADLSNNRIGHIIEDQENHIWATTYDGSVSRFDPATETFESVELPHGFIAARTHVFRNRHVWIQSKTNEALRLHYDSLQHCYQTDIRFKSTSNTDTERFIIYEDSACNEWIAGRHCGLYLNQQTSDTLQHISPIGVRCVFETNRQVLWGTMDGTVLTWDKLTRQCGSIRPGATSPIIAIFQDEGRLLYVTANDGIITHERQLRPSQHTYISARKDSQRRLWLGTNSGQLVMFDLRTHETQNFRILDDTHLKSFKPEELKVMEDMKGNVWIYPYQDYIGLYQDGIIYPIRKMNKQITWGGVNSHYVFFLDRQDNLWLSTSRWFGKITLKENVFRRISWHGDNNTSTTEENNIFRSIMQDKQGRVWVGNRAGEILLYTPEFQWAGKLMSDGHITTNRNHTAYIGRAYDILQDKHGRIWIGTKGDGLWLAKPTGQPSRPFSLTHFKHDPADCYSLNNDQIYWLLEDDTGRIWMATYGGGLCYAEEDEQGDIRFIHPGNRLRHYPLQEFDKLRCLCRDDKGRIWVGSTNGILLFSEDFPDPETLRFRECRHQPGDETSLSNNNVQNILQTRDGQLFIGTFGGGLCRAIMQPDGTPAFETQTPQKGVPADIIYAMVEDWRGNLWLAHENGLNRYDLRHHTFDYFDEQQIGFPPMFNEGQAILLNNGKLAFLTLNGLFYFRPQDTNKSHDVPGLTFTSLQLGGDPIRPGTNEMLPHAIDYMEKLSLPHKQNLFTIHFAALELTNPGNVSYAYMLEGFDAKWQEAGKQRSASYTNLPTGDYLLKIRSTNGDGVWVDNERTLRICVLPSFWETPVAWMLYVLLASLAVYVAHLFYKLRNRVYIEQQTTQYKLEFFTEISHELRTPLTLITAPIENLSHHKDLPLFVQEQLSMIRRNAERMQQLVNQILEFRKVQSGRLPVQWEVVEACEFTRRIALSFVTLAVERHMIFTLTSNTSRCIMRTDTDLLEKVINNLLSNAFKYTIDGKAIRIRIHAAPSQVTFLFCDEGIGIPKEEMDNIFKRFNSLHRTTLSGSPSTGIGLALVKELVNRLHGTIEVESCEGRGSTFKLTFPCRCEDFLPQTQEETLTPAETSRQSQPTQPTDSAETLPNPDIPTILLVEDNDDMRLFLRNIFRQDYRVLEAQQGEEGLSLARAQQPDIVLTDLMMPVMDGLQLVAALKNNLSTSHIPIVLLTAKEAIESRLSAMKEGADDYITKPFSTLYLKARIENLLEQRRKLQQLYREQLLDTEFAQTAADKTPPSSPAPEADIPEQDKLFLQKLTDLMNKQMDNSQLTVDMLIRPFYISRTEFFVKLKRLTGFSPQEFITQMRARHAAKLIVTSDYQMKEIAAMIGLDNGHYFSRFFKKVYGMTPMEYKKTHGTQSPE